MKLLLSILFKIFFLVVLFALCIDLLKICNGKDIPWHLILALMKLPFLFMVFESLKKEFKGKL